MKLSSYPILSGLLDLIFPRICPGCGKDISGLSAQPVCLFCLDALPHTGFACLEENPVEKIFRGRIGLRSAHSEFYYSGDSVIRTLIHRLKYKGDRETGVFLGNLLGNSLRDCGRFSEVELLIPLPLYPDKEYKRGYNQSALICEGISQVMKIPVVNNAMTRKRNTSTQTRKHRTERWTNVENSFCVTEAEKLHHKHVLLVDDVVTTGASLEACAMLLEKLPVGSLSIATVALSSK